MITRQDLDMEFVNRELHRETPYSVIAYKEAERLGVDPSQVSRSMISGIHRDLKNGKLTVTSNQPTSQDWIPTYRFGIDKDNGGVPLFVGHPRIDGNAVVISDPHFPATDYAEVERVNATGKRYDVKRLIIAGDLLDGATQNKFKRKVRPATMDTELNLGKQALQFWLEWYDEIWFEPGNHDDWFLENLDGELSINSLGRLLGMDEMGGRFIVTPYDRIHLFNGGQEWVIPHQKESSVNPLSVPEKLAWKYEANIVVPHQHKTAWGYDRYGRYVLIAIGGLHDQDKMAYVNLKTSTKPTYNKGYVVLENGSFDLVVPDPRVRSYRF